MWMIFALLAVVFTVMNLYAFSREKKYDGYMALALSFTALTLCAEYQMAVSWTLAGDFSALQDVLPYMGRPIWIATVISVAMNCAPAFADVFGSRHN